MLPCTNHEMPCMPRSSQQILAGRPEAKNAAGLRRPLLAPGGCE